MKLNRIGVLTAGGDAPGLNAVIRAVVKTAILHFHCEVVGIEDGFEGLLQPLQVHPLTLENVRGLVARGGTILGTRNKGRFSGCAVDPKTGECQAAYAEAVKNLKQLNIDGLVIIGGDGTQAIGHEFYKLGIPTVGVPKTIDNDLAATELTFGFNTAVAISTEALDRLHTTAESHDRVMVLEVMGRHTGWIALHSGLAGGADVILIPEIPFTMEKVAAKVMERERSGHLFSIIVVSEGAAPVGGSAVYYSADVSGGERRLGGISLIVGNEVARLTKKDTRVVILGHLQRGGSPLAMDRLLGSAFGALAVRTLAEGKSGQMVALKAGEIVTVPIAQAIANLKTVPPDGQLVKVARDLGISFGDE